MIINIAGIEEESFVDGLGIRYALFVQGCPHHCEGCHNPHTWEFKDNQLMDIKDIISAIKDNPLLDGVTFSGGEPFMQAEALSILAKQIHELGLNIWCYTGFKYEDIINNEAKMSLLKEVDVLVDGKFEIINKDISLSFKGSSNQRIIDVQQSLANNQIIEFVINS